MNDLIAHCGLDCEQCDARRATLTDSQELREKTAKLWSELNGVPITADMINCEGCRRDGMKTPFCEKLCPIRQCALKKNITLCAQCPEKEQCETIKMISTETPEAPLNTSRR